MQAPITAIAQRQLQLRTQADLPATAPVCAPVADGTRRSGQASGRVSSDTSASPVIAFAQPAAPIVSWTSGANTNWPSEPPALIRPAANERRSGAMRCAVAPIRTEKLPAPAPAAASTPSDTIKPHSLVHHGARPNPAASSTPPNISTGSGPR